MGFFERWRSPEVPKIEKKSEQQPPQEAPVQERVDEGIGHEGATVELPKGPDADTQAEREAFEDSEGRFYKELEVKGMHVRVSWDPEHKLYTVYIPEMAPEAPDAIVTISEKAGDAQKTMMAASTYIERGMRGKKLYDALEQYVRRGL